MNRLNRLVAYYQARTLTHLSYDTIGHWFVMQGTLHKHFESASCWIHKQSISCLLYDYYMDDSAILQPSFWADAPYIR
jgi:hypothetical protein